MTKTNGVLTFERFIYNDGGRAAAGFKGETGDCVCRAIAIATGKPYREVFDGLNALSALFYQCRHEQPFAETGIDQHIASLYLGQRWSWIPIIQEGRVARLRRYELPTGRIIVALTKHLVAVIDRVVHDTGDYWRGRRQVFGYFTHSKLNS
jgi:hypothetical protein